MEPRISANVSFNDLLTILQNCPAHDQGIHFAYLDDIKPDSQYGFRLEFDGEDGPHGLYAACLIASPNRSDKPIPVSINGPKVVTHKVKDIANPKGSMEEPVGDHTVVGYCTLDNLSGFKLDPPRGQPFRVALVLFSGADETEGFQIHKMENIEPSNVKSAIRCWQKLRTMTKRLRSDSTDKRTRTMDLGDSPENVKRARSLPLVPPDESMHEMPTNVPTVPSSFTQ